MIRRTLLHINGEWRCGDRDRYLSVINPATEAVIGSVAQAGISDLELAVRGAKRGFDTWRQYAPHERSRVLRGAGELLRRRARAVARTLTAEQGKPVAQAEQEIIGAAETIEWFAEEARRCFGQTIPARTPGYDVSVRLEPVGPVAAFSPWNFPVSQAAKKLGAALAAGCSVILKGPEETPESCAELVRAFLDSELPPTALSLVFGHPPQIAEFLIPHQDIRKVSFTGSVVVGKQLAALAGTYMKRVTMELGGHAPVIVCGDANIDEAVAALARLKYLNCGQACISPTRFIIERWKYDDFVKRFSKVASGLKVGDGLSEDTYVGPLANKRRLDAMQALVADAVSQGSRLVCGGKRRGNQGFFFEPTLLADVPTGARIMNEEPFGPIALALPFDSLEEAIAESNRLPFALAAYAYTSSRVSEAYIAHSIEAGMVMMNCPYQSMPEAPFGGVKDSGYGTEGGVTGILEYLNTKLVTRFAQ
jgi:succinate-semialdehyde dehydrogenase/glutarate-semialdehyde dehydrogenase